MKKIIFFIAFLMLAGMASAAVNTQYFGKSPNILVTLIRQEPDPIEPGKEFEVTFKIDNNGTTANNVLLEILPEYPFSIVPGELQTRELGVVGTTQSEKQTVITRFKLKVAQDASDGSHRIKARYKSDGSDSWATLENFKIRVQTSDALLGVEKFFSVPAVTAPGDKAKLTIELKNYASSSLKNIKVSLDLEEEEEGSMPFAPVGTSNQRIYTYLEANSNLPVAFELLVDSGAASKAYKIPLEFGYSDYLNKNYSKSSFVTLIVGDRPDLGITLERTEVYTPETPGNVVLRLVNKGNPDIKFLNVKVIQNENVKVAGADESYIGKLDSDDFSTAEFRMFLKGEGTIKIPVQLSYKDTNNNDYRENREVELKLYSDNEAEELGVKSGNGYTWMVITLAVIGAGYYSYRRRKNKK
ncbi:hypothetical protein HYX09_01500 [Candidatus Woesearchaeota archaeon]|nr:hypothetical protein [Candidatus Woesearchaeota archaeon]